MSRIKLDSCSEETLKLNKSSRRNKSGRKPFEILNAIEIIEEEIVSDDEEEEIDPLEKLKERLLSAIDGAEEKSFKIRTQSLKIISELLIHNYIWEVIEPRKLTISEIIENSLRNGKGAERELAARVALLLQIQLGDDYEYMESLDQLLLKTVADKLNSFAVRAECCSVLGLLYFIQYEDIEDIIKLMQQLEQIFITSEKSTISADESVLHAAALFSYGLLATRISPDDIALIYKRLCVSINHMIKLLDSPHMNLRLASGETIAVLTECGTSRNPKIMHDLIPHIFSVTKYLSVKNRRNRHKQKSKSTQRATFKDIDRYIEDNIQLDITVQFGTESITLKTWAAYHQYMALCNIIGPGINVHLTKNDFIRDILQLNENIVYPVVKQYNQHAKNQAVSRRRDRQYKKEYEY